MAQYIKKLQSGGKPESENEQKKQEKKLFKTDFGDYDADQIIKSYQSQLNRYADNVGLRGNKREQFITAGYGILDDLKNGNIRREGRKFWGPNMSDGNKEQAWALQLLEDVINKTPVYKGEQEEEKPKEKQKFDINGIQKQFINTYYGGNNKADITSWLDRDLADETGKRGNANRIAEFTNMLKAYSESLKDKDLDFEGSAYANLNDYQSKLNAAIDALNNGTWDNDDAIALDQIGIGKALRNQLFGDGTEQSQPAAKQYRDMTDEEKLQAIVNSMKADQQFSNYSDEQINGMAAIELEKRKREAEQQYRQLQDENEWAKQEERYKALNQDVINGFNVHFTSDQLYDINDYNDFNENLKKAYADYYDYLYDLLSEQNSPKYSQYYSLLDDVKENRNTLHNILYHNFHNDGITHKEDISRQENINRKKVLGALLYADIQQNGDNPDYYIKNNDDYIIVPTITDNGYAWSFNPKTGYIQRINYTSNNEAFNKYLKEQFLKKKRQQVSSNKKGGQIISLRKFQNAGKINSTVLNARRQYAKKKAQNKNDFYTKKAKDTGKTEEQIEYENKPIGFNSVDTARAAAIVADITGMITAVLPGGSLVSSISGIGSTGANAFADFNDKSLSSGERWKNLGINFMGDLAGALPFAGTYFKSAKIVRNAARLVPKLLTLYNAGQVSFDDNVRNSLKKIINEGEKLTLEDWRNIATAFSALAGVTRMSTLELKSRAARNAGKIKTITEPEISIETKNKGTKTLTQEQFDKVKNAKTVEEAQNIIQGFGGDFADVELNQNHSERKLKNWLRSTPNNKFDQSDFIIKQPETVLDYDDVLNKLGNSGKAQEIKMLRSVQTPIVFNNFKMPTFGYSYKKGGQIMKAQNGTLSDLFKKKYKETELPEWYAKNNFYTQQRLNEWNPEYDMSQSGKLNGYPLHRQQADLKSAYILNNAYTSNHQAVSNDLNNYYKNNNNLSASDFVKLYNDNAGIIRKDFENKTDLTYKNNNWRDHNKLFRQMFNSRSLGEGTNLYDLGYDEPSEDILGSTTWHRRMDRYENEFDKLTDIEQKKARVHKIGDGKNAFYVYKKANGDIELLSDEDRTSLGLNQPINNPQVTNNNSANPSQNATIQNHNNNNNNTRASIDNTEGQPEGKIEGGRVEGFNSPEERRANQFGKKLIQGMTEIVPDTISAGRFISNLHAKDTNYRTLQNLRVPQKSLKQGNRDVYRSLNIEQEGERQASQLQSLAGKATTSDEAMNYAKQLEAQTKASEIKRNTQLQSDQVARQTHEQQLARIKELIDYNTNVKDVNTAALVEAYNELLKLKAATRTAKQQDINTYLMEIEQRLRTKQADKKTKQDWLDQQIMSAKASEVQRNDPTYQRLLTDYLEAPSGTQKKVDALRALRVWSYEVQQNQLWDQLGQFADANKLDKSQIPVHRSGTKIDDTDVKKRTRDHDRLAKQVLASIRSTERSINNASKSKLLSIKKFLDLWK